MFTHLKARISNQMLIKKIINCITFGSRLMNCCVECFNDIKKTFLHIFIQYYPKENTIYMKTTVLIVHLPLFYCRMSKQIERLR